MAASMWAYKAARQGVTLPVPQAVFDRLARQRHDDTIDNLQIRPKAPSHLCVSGRKKAGVWIEFSALFRLEPPGPDDPARSLVLVPEKIRPFPAKSSMLGAIAGLDGFERSGDRLRFDLDRFLGGHEWGSRIPAGVRERVRVAEVTADDRKLRLQFRIASRAGR
jgi:hypothetical protein